MKLLRTPYYVSGFLWREPLEELPVLTHGGEAHTAPNFKLSSHSHVAFEFLYILRGSLSWRIGTEVAVQQMGDLIVMYPGEEHEMDKKADAENQRIWIGVDLENLGPEGRRLARRLRQNTIRVIPRCHAAEPIMQAIVRQAVSNLPQRGGVILNYLRVLVSVVEQRYLAMRREAFTVERTKLPYTHAIQKAVSHMERYLNRHIPLSELASIAVIGHAENFCTQFKREVGVTPAAYHLKLRLNAARSELLQPDANITLIALEFGFSSSQHFSTSFRHAFGTSPRAWQQKSLNSGRTCAR